jgi:hypothetical protein
MFQTITLIEHLFTSAWFPIPRPRVVGATDPHCIWQTSAITYAEQLRGFKELFALSQHYIAATFSLPYDPVLYSNRVIIMAAIFACFDSLVRNKPTDQVSALTKTLIGGLYLPFELFSSNLRTFRFDAQPTQDWIRFCSSSFVLD